MTLAILVGLVVIAVAAAFLKGGGQLAWQGTVQTGRLIESIWLRLPLGFLLGGFIQVLIPRAIIARWLGPESGIKGILIASYAGVIMSGAPYVMLPVVASLYLAGAGPGPVIALVTGQMLLGVQTLIVWQISFLGVGLPLARFLVSLVITPFIGLAGAAVFRLLKRLPDLEREHDHDAHLRRQKESEKP